MATPESGSYDTEICVCFERAIQLLSLLLLVSNVNQVSESALGLILLKSHQQCHFAHRVKDRIGLRVSKYK